MYCIGDTIVYGNQGVFNIAEITTQNIGGTAMDYFLLKSAFNMKTVIYVPCGNEKLLSKMKKILSADEINELIASLPEQDSIWVENEAERKEHYKDIISSGDRLMMLRLIKTLHQHRDSCQQRGRKMHQCDEKAFKEAERLIYDEFSLVLGIDKKDVIPYIVSKIENR